MLVKYTYYGDTDLNGVVNFDDYSRTDNGFNTGGTDWFHGDFDYNGVVNFDDYSLIDLAFNTQSGSLGLAIQYLDGSDRSSVESNTPALQRVQRARGAIWRRVREQFPERGPRTVQRDCPWPGHGVRAAPSQESLVFFVLELLEHRAKSRDAARLRLVNALK